MPLLILFFLTNLNKIKNKAQNIQIYTIVEVWSEKSSNASTNKGPGRSAIQGGHTWAYGIYFDALWNNKR